MLEEHWAPSDAKTPEWSKTKNLWRHVFKCKQKVSGNYTVRVIREKKFREEFCGNFARCTVQNIKLDIALEIVEKDDSNAILVIEVKFREKSNEADCHIRNISQRLLLITQVPHVFRRKKEVGNNIVRVMRERKFRDEFCGNLQTSVEILHISQ